MSYKNEIIDVEDLCLDQKNYRIDFDRYNTIEEEVDRLYEDEDIIGMIKDIVDFKGLHPNDIPIVIPKDDSRNTFNIKYLNKNDIRMVKGLLCFQKKIFENTKNIFDYLVTLMSEHSLIEAYQCLTKIDYVGDKLAAFTLRDIMFLSEKSRTIKLKPCDYLILFPIDTRVNKKSMEILGIDKKLTKTNKTNKIDPLILKIRLINLCGEQGFIENDPLAPLKLNAGMWYNFENNKSKN